MKHALISVLSLIAPLTAFAHETAEPHEEGLLVIGDFNWDAWMAQPTSELKIDYLGQYLILPNFATYCLVVALLFGLIYTFFRIRPFILAVRKTKKMKRKLLASLVTHIVMYGLFLLLTYSVFIFYKERAEKGIIVCPTPEECTISMHIHAEVHVLACNDPVVFPREKGALNSAHTHKEKNIIHWHDTTTYDSVASKVIDDSELTLREFFTQTEHSFDGECFDQLCNKDLCNEKPGSWQLWVNEERITENIADFVWKDKDVVNLVFQDENRTRMPDNLDWEYSGP